MRVNMGGICRRDAGRSFSCLCLSSLREIAGLFQEAPRQHGGGLEVVIDVNDVSMVPKDDTQQLSLRTSHELNWDKKIMRPHLSYCVGCLYYRSCVGTYAKVTGSSDHSHEQRFEQDSIHGGRLFPRTIDQIWKIFTRTEQCILHSVGLWIAVREIGLLQALAERQLEGEDK